MPNRILSSHRQRYGKAGAEANKAAEFSKKGAVQPGKAANFTGKNRRFFLKSGCILQVKFALLLEESHKGSSSVANSTTNFSKKFSNNDMKVQQLFAKVHRTILKSLGGLFREDKLARQQGFRNCKPAGAWNRKNAPKGFRKTFQGFMQNVRRFRLTRQEVSRAIKRKRKGLPRVATLRLCKNRATVHRTTFTVRTEPSDNIWRTKFKPGTNAGTRMPETV